MVFSNIGCYSLSSRAALVLIFFLSACVATPEKPSDENLLFYAKAERGYQLWSGWDFFIKQPNGWYHDGEYVALPITNSLIVDGEWYNPEKAVRREHLEVVASTGILFPPNFIFIAGLRPDRRCRAVFEFQFEAREKYAIYKSDDTDNEVVILKLYSPANGRELGSAICN